MNRTALRGATRQILAGTALLLPCALPAQPANGVKPHAGMLRYPDVSKTHIVFLYANDLWLVPREGGTALPLSSPSGTEVLPKFAPDGKTIAFVGNYDGNRDLYTLPVEGGVPTRVTHHPVSELLCDWTPDNRLLYASNGFVGLGRQQQLFTAPAKGGAPTKLPVPYGTDAAISPDGRWLAYLLHTTDSSTWKRYRGGMATDIWLFDLKEKKSKKITDWEGTDTLPMWNGEKVVYLSDNGPEHRLNLWQYDTKSGKRQQLTRFTDYDVRWPSIGPGPNGKGEVVFQHGPALKLFDLDSSKSWAVEVRIPGDRPRLRARTIETNRFITAMGISPSGKRAAIEARGDIWTAPAKEGSPRNLTRTSGVAERDPAWSPDGQWIAYFSDKTGEYEMYVMQSDGKGETKQLTKSGKNFYYVPAWSPDSKHLLYSDKAGNLSLYTLATGQSKAIDRDPLGAPLTARWSADSRWITYSRSDDKTRNGIVTIYNVEKGEKKQITSGMFSDSNPVFDRKGDYLFFSSTRSFNPTYEDLGSTWVYNGTEVMIALPLRPEVASPYAPKSDEETWSGEKKDAPKTFTLDLTRSELSASNSSLIPHSSSLPTHPSAVVQDTDEVSGVWNGTATVNGNPVPFKLTLKLGANNTLTGTIEAMGQTLDVTGTYNPGTKELTLTFTLGDDSITLNAKIAGNRMTGSASGGGDNNAPIQAEKVGGASPKPAVPGQPAPAGQPAQAAKGPAKVEIDFTDIERRAIQLPIQPGNFGQIAVNDKNQLLFTRAGSRNNSVPSGIKLFDLNDEKREEKMVAAGGGGFEVTPDGKKLLVVRGNTGTIQDASAGAQGEAVVTTGMTATIEPREEWKQMFNEAWRVERDFFYDPNMHGVDWNAVREQYGKMVADAASREDLSFIISEMIAELNVGHAYYQGGDVEAQPAVSVGLLGADLELHEGAYRIAKIYRGAAWDTDAVGPLSQPGVKVKTGDYLLAVNGAPVDTSKDPYAAFQGMADRVVTITVSEKPKMDASARDIPLRLLGSENTLRYRDWIEQKRAYVEKQSGGRVGYIYVPDTGINGQNDLFRQFVGNRGKDALIIDERWNGGGQIPTRFIELLNRPITNYWARRDHADWAWPQDGHQGPKCMLINGLAGSGGDAFPYYFKQAKLGKTIGMRTWGGLVGISGNPGLIDGGGVTAPTFAFYEKDGTWGVEGHGVDPDIEVVDDPALMTDGGDPQLDAAIKHMLDELKRSPYVAPKRPSYPNRKGLGVEDKDK